MANISYLAPVAGAANKADAAAKTAKWEKLTGYCLTQYFIDNYFDVDLKSSNGAGIVYPITFEECKSRCESMDRETNPCNGFKMTTIPGTYSQDNPGYCKGTYKEASYIKNGHLVPCTSSECGECEPSVMNSWEYWTWEQPGKITRLITILSFENYRNILF